MDFDTYQALASETKIYPTAYSIIYPTLKLNGEAGEIAEKVGKCIRDGKVYDRVDLAKEVGDVLWYCYALASDLGFSLDEIAQMNLSKLASRKERGTLSGSGDDR